MTRSRWFPGLVLVVLGAALFGLAAIFSDDNHGVKWVLGGIGWFGFLLCALLFILWLVWTLVQTMRGRRQTV